MATNSSSSPSSSPPLQSLNNCDANNNNIETNKSSTLLSSLSLYLEKLEKENEHSTNLLHLNKQCAYTARSIFNTDFMYLGRTTFSKKQNENTKQIACKVYSFKLSRLLISQSKEAQETRNKIKKVLQLNRLHDLVHAICALYNLSLPDIEPQHIYNCICAKKSVTICLVKENGQEENTNENDDEDRVVVGECRSQFASTDNLNQLEQEMNLNSNDTKSIFENVFSDDDHDEEKNPDDHDDESEESSDDEDFTQGIKTFLDKSKEKICELLVGCATLERVNTYQQPSRDEHVIDLQLLSVRSKYRGFKMGKYFMQHLVQNQSIVGQYDAIVTSSDSDAEQFYAKYAFISDPILNSKYSHIGDLWTNTTKMCYIPPYQCETQQRDDENESSYISELTFMEKDFKRWQKTMFSAYQTQAQLFYKFKQEILSLKAKMCAKDSLIEDLKMKNDLLLRKNRLLKIQMSSMKSNGNEDFFGHELADASDDFDF